ncbi:MAG: bifunctional adenosylcobinamide kinase/adenosylcobinamide-phosphate guanylyltransferase [Nitrospira sp.]|nr:bifunctional adenosylcobinamide kinase/adenosylcobinamide-phosphate guanylyltransferase [Nitrospira sp.]
MRTRRPGEGATRRSPRPRVPASPRRGARSRVILVIGGASSGKSAAALELAERGMAKGAARAFVATGQPLDEEMADRIRLHQASRGAEWQTEEVPVDLAAWFEKQGRGFRAIILDCLTLWLSNLKERGGPDEQVPDLVATLLRAVRDSEARVVVVSNELGLGLVPADASARRFRDLAGKVNQQVAGAADEVYFIVAGQALQVK